MENLQVSSENKQLPSETCPKQRGRVSSKQAWPTGIISAPPKYFGAWLPLEGVSK